MNTNKTRPMNSYYLKGRLGILFFIFLISLFISCSNSPTSNNQVPAPELWTSNEWEEATPASQNMDILKLNELSGSISRGELGRINSLLIIRNGKLIFEKYYKNMHADSLHQIFSVTKSFMSALFGMALEDGYVGSVDDKILDYFPEYPYSSLANPSEYKKDLTLEHFLTMSAGFYCTEGLYSYTDSRNTVFQVCNSPTPYKTLFDMPITRPPGNSFQYNSSLSLVLGGILEREIPGGLEQYAIDNFFNPLGIDEFYWIKNYFNGHLMASGELFLTPRDMAKLGQLYLDKGVWRGQQIVPADWVELSTQEHIPAFGWTIRYGYQWWLESFKKPGSISTEHYPHAHGLHGQHIYLIKDYNMILVTTATPNAPGKTMLKDIIEDYIFPAIL
jgi:CubicO group peptidase (beta-lactamase class C family)